MIVGYTQLYMVMDGYTMVIVIHSYGWLYMVIVGYHVIHNYTQLYTVINGYHWLSVFFHGYVRFSLVVVIVYIVIHACM